MFCKHKKRVEGEGDEINGDTSPGEDYTFKRLYYDFYILLCNRFPALDPFKIDNMPAIEVFELIGNILEFESKPKENIEEKQQIKNQRAKMRKEVRGNNCCVLD